MLLPLLVALVANAGVLGAGRLAAEARGRRRRKSRRARRRATLAAARREDLLAKQARTGKERADVELQKFYAEILPQDVCGRHRGRRLLAGRRGRRDRPAPSGAGQWERETIRDSQLTKVTGKVTLTGEYANIRRFLYNVETAQEFVIIEKVELSQANTAQASSLLEVSLSVATYFLGAR